MYPSRSESKDDSGGVLWDGISLTVSNSLSKPNYPNLRRNIDSIEGNRGISATNQRYKPSWPTMFPCWTSLVFARNTKVN